MNYRGYEGSIKWSKEDRCWHGKIEGIKDLMSYEASSWQALAGEFIEAVDEYILCLENGEDNG